MTRMAVLRRRLSKDGLPYDSRSLEALSCAACATSASRNWGCRYPCKPSMAHGYALVTEFKVIDSV
jgi:hypothetical protein